jgi:hypothetical protein
MGHSGVVAPQGGNAIAESEAGGLLDTYLDAAGSRGA